MPARVGLSGTLPWSSHPDHTQWMPPRHQSPIHQVSKYQTPSQGQIPQKPMKYFSCWLRSYELSTTGRKRDRPTVSLSYRTVLCEQLQIGKRGGADSNHVCREAGTVGVDELENGQEDGWIDVGEDQRGLGRRAVLTLRHRKHCPEHLTPVGRRRAPCTDSCVRILEVSW